MYKIKTSTSFDRSIKKLFKKYPKVKQDCLKLLEKLEQGIFDDDKIQGFSGNIFKVRIGSTDQKKGKSGGFRVIYYVVTKNKKVVLLTIYAKAQQETITNQEIKNILNKG